MLYKFLKRTLDLGGAIFGLLFFSPIFLVTAVAIKLDSRGPVLVEKSDRVGEEGKIFRMYKFRSMVADAHVKIKKDPRYKDLYKKFEKNNFKLENDPRITQVGDFIRKTSIDELPQFFNVLVGNMSLVGPRALYPEELAIRRDENQDLSDQIDVALSVKPGLTGPWQVSGRAELDFRERIKLDSEYAGKKSIVYDFSVLVKTVPAVIKGKGAQ
ncbi:MAG: sugar transferase [Candidatus Woykebacteria bacterium]